MKKISVSFWRKTWLGILCLALVSSPCLSAAEGITVESHVVGEPETTVSVTALELESQEETEIQGELQSGEAADTESVSVDAEVPGFAGAGVLMLPAEMVSVSSGEYQGNGLLVAIDPGHQAHQNSDQEPVGPGSSETKMKVSSGTWGDYTDEPEYELNLKVALKLRDELEARGYEVLMIRETNDVNISNVERAQMANEAEADAFLRIHADGSDNHDISGCMTICQTPSNSWNGDIYPECKALAQSVLSGLVESTGARSHGVLESDTYSGINWCEVPVTIVEMGYMSNREEDYLLQTEEYQDKLVEGMANGLDAFFDYPERPQVQAPEETMTDESTAEETAEEETMIKETADESQAEGSPVSPSSEGIAGGRAAAAEQTEQPTSEFLVEVTASEETEENAGSEGVTAGSAETSAALPGQR